MDIQQAIIALAALATVLDFLWKVLDWMKRKRDRRMVDQEK